MCNTSATFLILDEDGNEKFLSPAGCYVSQTCIFSIRDYIYLEASTDIYTKLDINSDNYSYFPFMDTALDKRTI